MFTFNFIMKTIPRQVIFVTWYMLQIHLTIWYETFLLRSANMEMILSVIIQVPDMNYWTFCTKIHMSQSDVTLEHMKLCCLFYWNESFWIKTVVLSTSCTFVIFKSLTCNRKAYEATSWKWQVILTEICAWLSFLSWLHCQEKLCISRLMWTL